MTNIWPRFIAVNFGLVRPDFFFFLSARIRVICVFFGYATRFELFGLWWLRLDERPQHNMPASMAIEMAWLSAAACWRLAVLRLFVLKSRVKRTQEHTTNRVCVIKSRNCVWNEQEKNKTTTKTGGRVMHKETRMLMSARGWNMCGGVKQGNWVCGKRVKRGDYVRFLATASY